MFAHLDTISTTKGIERELKMKDFERKARVVQTAESTAAESVTRSSTNRESAADGFRRLVNVVSFGIVGRIAATR